jgi:hypothetical protein
LDDCAHDVARRFAVDKNPLPHFEIHEQPQAIAVAAQSAVVLCGQLFHSSAAEQAAAERAWTQDELVDDG